MKRIDATRACADLATSQRGFFTAAQARSVGVDKLALSRLCTACQVERVGHGIYRAAGVPGFREEALYATWLGLMPEVPSYQRPKDETDFVVSHATAAWLHGLGEVNPEPFTFTHSSRHQTRSSQMRFVRSVLGPQDVTIVAGMPATTIARTVLDLLSDGEDLSLVASVFSDALRVDPSFADESFIARMDAFAVKYGFKKGFSICEYLRK